MNPDQNRAVLRGGRSVDVQALQIGVDPVGLGIAVRDPFLDRVRTGDSFVGL